MRISDWSSDVCSSDLVSSPATANSASSAADRKIISKDCIIWISHPGTGPSAQQFTALLSAAGAAAPMASGAPRAATVRRQRYAAATWGRGECDQVRSEEHTSELQSLMRTSHAVLC